MLIIDGDYPMAGGAIRSQRPLTLPIEQARGAPPDFPASPGRPDDGIMATIPEMRKAKVAVAVVKVLGCVLRDGHDHGDVRTDELSYAQAQGQLDETGVFGQEFRCKRRVSRCGCQDLPCGLRQILEGELPVR